MIRSIVSAFICFISCQAFATPNFERYAYVEDAGGAIYINIQGKEISLDVPNPYQVDRGRYVEAGEYVLTAQSVLAKVGKYLELRGENGEHARVGEVSADGASLCSDNYTEVCELHLPVVNPMKKINRPKTFKTFWIEIK